MNEEVNYGELLLHCEVTLKEVLKKRLPRLIVAFIFLAGAIISFVTAESETDIQHLYALVCGIASLIYFLKAYTIKPSEALIYKGGMLYKWGAKTQQAAFSDVKGIRSESFRFSLSGLELSFLTSYWDTLVLKEDSSSIILKNTNTPDFHEVSRELNAAYMEYLLEGLSFETLSSASISFGDQLELLDGELIFTKGKNTGQDVIAISDIHNIFSDDEGFYTWIEGAPNEKGKNSTLAKITSSRALNLEALYRIVNMVKSDQVKQ